MSLQAKSYVAVTVTLTAQDTNYNLLTLVQAIEENAPATGRELNLQSLAGNAESSLIRIGDASMGAARWGVELAPGESRLYRSESISASLASKFVRGSAAGLKLNVEIETR